MEIIDFLELTDDKYKENLLKLYNDIKNSLQTMPAAIRHHHSEFGGLYRHILEVIKISVCLFENFKNSLQKRNIEKSDVILVSFIHDLEKVNKYKLNKNYDPSLKYTKGYKETEFGINYDIISTNDTAKVTQICAKYGIILSDNHINAITYHHGGWSVDAQYATLHPLAAILHSADLISSTLFKEKK